MNYLLIILLIIIILFTIYNIYCNLIIWYIITGKYFSGKYRLKDTLNQHFMATAEDSCCSYNLCITKY